MTPDIVRVAPASDEEWQRVWEVCSTATYFHSPEWARVWAAYSKGRIRPAAKRVLFSDGAEAVVPLCFEIKSRGLLSRHVGSTQGTYGGWLSSAPLDAAHAAQLVQWLMGGQGTSLVWRMNPYDESAFRAGVLEGLSCRADVTHAIRLPPSPEQLLTGFKASYRTQIRKAIRSGEFTLSLATTLQEWREYFAVYQDSLGRWGEAPAAGYGWRLFELWARLRSPNVKLWIARQHGKIVSGDLCLYAPRHVAYWHGCTLQSHLKTCVAKLLKFEVMQDAVRRGLDWYDFNPSAGLAGVKFFKEGFNPTVLPAPLVYVDSPLKQLVRGVAAALQLRHARVPSSPLQELLESHKCAPLVARLGSREAASAEDMHDAADAESGLRASALDAPRAGSRRVPA